MGHDHEHDALDDDDLDDDDLDDTFGVGAGDDEYPGSPDDDDRAERLLFESQSRKAFGAECRVMVDLLRVHGIDATFDDAKQWVRQFAEYNTMGEMVEGSATRAAARWLDEGWFDFDQLKWVLLHGDAEEVTERLEELGTTVAAVQRTGVDASSILHGEAEPPANGGA